MISSHFRATGKAIRRLVRTGPPLETKSVVQDNHPDRHLTIRKHPPGALTSTRLLSAQGLLPAMAMVLILGAALGLRVYRLDLVGFNSDEAVYAGQAAAIANDPELTPFFPIFRAHPLLVQFLLALVFESGVNDLLGRLVAAAFGVGTVFLVYRLATLLYDWRAGIFAALFMALMPYHVVVSRQLLLDGPEVFFATLSLYLLARYALTQKRAWLYAAGAGMGLTFLAKETGVVLVASIYAFFALSPQIRVRLRDLALSTFCMALVIAPFPLSLTMAGAGGSQTAQRYLVWQLLRRPNHAWTFYPSTVPFEIGPLLILLVLFGLWFFRREHSWRENLLLSWILVPAIFFQLWPVKGYQYLLPIAPPIAVLAGRTLSRLLARDQIGRLGSSLRFPRVGIAAAIVAVSLLIPTWQRLQPLRSASVLAGSGGVPGGREAGRWVEQNVPDGATLMTIGPSMANILQYYGHRRAYGLSVSPNPLHRNPSYDPIPNPDLSIRYNDIQFVVWDSFSAARSVFFSEKLLGYVERYNGRVVHTETVGATTPDGKTAQTPIIVIYQVHP